MFTNHLGKKTEVMCFRNSCLGKKKNPSATKCCEDVTKKMPMCSCILRVMVQAELRSTHSNSGPASSSISDNDRTTPSRCTSVSVSGKVNGIKMRMNDT